MKQNVRRWLLVGLAVLLGALLGFWGGWALSSRRAEREGQGFALTEEFCAALLDYDGMLDQVQWALEHDPDGLWFQHYLEELPTGSPVPRNLGSLHGLSYGLYDLAEGFYRQVYALGQAYQEGDPDLPAMLQQMTRHCETGKAVITYLDSQLTLREDLLVYGSDHARLMGDNLLENWDTGRSEESQFVDPAFYTIQQEVEALIPDDLQNIEP